MKTAFLTTRKEKPSYRFRVEQFLPYLRSHGVICDVFTIPPAGRKRWRLFRSLAAYDIVLLQKKLLRLFDLLVLRGSSRCFIYDVDDAVMFRESEGLVELPPRRRRRFRATVRSADLVIAGNDYLCRWTANDAFAVTCFRTVVDTERWRPASRRSGDPFVIGWSGSRSTNRYINAVLPVLASLAERHRIRLSIVSDTREGIELGLCGGLQTVFSPWNSETEVEKIQAFDIGLMPLPKNGWTRGKCALKALLYMACGVPAVCSSWGAVRDVITDGEDGFLVDNDENWYAVIDRLLGDEALRERVSRRGRETVVSRFSLARAAPQLLEILRGLGENNDP